MINRILDECIAIINDFLSISDEDVTESFTTTLQELRRKLSKINKAKLSLEGNDILTEIYSEIDTHGETYITSLPADQTESKTRSIVNVIKSLLDSMASEIDNDGSEVFETLQHLQRSISRTVIMFDELMDAVAQDEPDWMITNKKLDDIILDFDNIRSMVEILHPRFQDYSLDLLKNTLIRIETLSTSIESVPNASGTIWDTEFDSIFASLKQSEQTVDEMIKYYER